jgi:DNA primase
LGSSNVGNLRRRVIVPSFDANGETNYHVSRTIDPAGTYGKYVNADLNKIEIVFNELNIDWTQKLVLVEGPFDLMKCTMNATCLLGSTLSPKSLLFQKILEHETPIILMLDDEMQGKAQQLGKLLQSFNIPVSVVMFKSGHDPGEMTFDEVTEYVENAKSWTWNNFLSHKLSAAMNCRLKF